MLAAALTTVIVAGDTSGWARLAQYPPRCREKRGLTFEELDVMQNLEA